MKSIFRPLLAAMAFVCLAAAPVMSQTTAVSASHLGGTAPFANATIYWQAIVPARVGSNQGQVAGVPQAATVTAGAFSLTLADALASSPNTCYAVTAIDNATGMTLLGAGLTAKGTVTQGGAYGCVQPTGSTWSFDTYVPPATPPAIYAPVPGPQGPAGTSWNWRGSWAADTAYAQNDAYAEGGNGYVVFSAYTSGSTFGSTDTSHAVELTATPSGPGIIVTCGGSNDQTVLQDALNAHGLIYAGGSCVLPSSPSNYLTIYSDTQLKLLAGATVTQEASTPEPIIQNAANGAAAQRTLTDVVVTAGSQTITSATGFTSADKGNSIACNGAYGTGYGFAGELPNVFHTSIAQVVSSTSAILADPPTTSVNPATCAIYVRDRNISIDGGTWYQNSGSSTYPTATGITALAFETIDGLKLSNLKVEDGDGSTPCSSAGQKLVGIRDFSNAVYDNNAFQACELLQDGLDLIGPGRGFFATNPHGQSGDDFFAMFAGFGTDAGYNPHAMQGVIDGVYIYGLHGSSAQLDRAVGMTGPYGMPIPIRNVYIYGDHGDPGNELSGSLEAGGFLEALQCSYGSFDNIVLNNAGGLLYQGIFQANACTIGSVKIENPSQTANVFNTCYVALIQNATINSTNRFAAIQNLEINGYKTNGYDCSSVITQETGSTITNVLVNNLQLANMSGGIFRPFDMYGNVGDFEANNDVFQYNSTSGTLGGCFFCFTGSNGGIAPSNSTVGKIGLHHVSVTEGSGSAAIGPLVYVAAAGGYTPAAGNLVEDDVSLDASAANQSTDALFAVSGGTLENAWLTNSYANGIGNCQYGTVSGTTVISGVVGTSVTNPGTCGSTAISTSGAVTSPSGTTTTAHTFSVPFSATPKCTMSAESNAGAAYFSTLPSTTSSGVITYATSGAQTFSETCTGAGGAW